MENDDSYLMISGLKHFQFCKRRWALVHIEQQWDENWLTLSGHYMHDRVHDDSFVEKRGSVVYSRGMSVRSETLKITGVCDMVELHEDTNGIPIQGREGKWSVYPVEYKHGKPDPRMADEMQLCAQAICLEEMFATTIPAGAIYYGELRHRKEVTFSKELREEVIKSLKEMYDLLERGKTPKARLTKVCPSCSMYEVCQPRLCGVENASAYVRRKVREGVED